MPTIINGTTGIDTIQDNTVTSAKISNGAVTATDLASTLDLTGKTVTLPAGVGGKVLQVVQGSLASGTWSTTSGSFVDTGLVANITPSSTSNKVLVIFTGTIDTNQSVCAAVCSIYRNGSSVASEVANQYTASGGYLNTTVSFCYLDSPSSTSSTAYKIYSRVRYGSGTISQSGLWTLTVMEIAG